MSHLMALSRSAAESNIFTLRARFVFPVAGPPLAGGCVTIAGERIAAVGATAREAPVHDLGNVAILPGLVNAHTHLEFSDLDSPLGRPGQGFAHWISEVTASRGRSTQVAATAEPLGAAPPQPTTLTSPVAQGLAESLAAGVTTVGEIAVTGWSAAPFAQAGIDATVFRELICLSPARIPAALAIAREHLEGLVDGGCRSGISPHAPYTVHPELFAQVVTLAAARNAPVAFHLAESPDELELLRSGTGPFYEYLAERGFWVPGVIPPGTRPLDYLRQLAQVSRGLVIHGNLLDEEEQAFVAQQRARLSVIYCPRTHAYFGHPRHPLQQLLERGAHVALGTDSRASNPDLDLLAEMRFVASHFPQLSGETIVRLGTLSGAEALGVEETCGSLVSGKLANLAIIALPESAAADPYDLLLGASLPCLATFLRGRVVAGSLPT